MRRYAADPHLARLGAWLEDNHATGLGRVFIADFEHGGLPIRGIGISEDVTNDSLIFCIPSTCWAHYELNLKFGSEVEYKADCLDQHKLAIWSAHQHKLGNVSFYAPYFLQFPSEASYRSFHPGYLNEGFEGANYWDSWFEALEVCHDGLTTPSFEEVKLAYIQQVSRTFDGAGMVPMADMCNTGTADELNVKPVWGENGDFCLAAKRDLVAGDELLVDYGQESVTALEFFAKFGFALDPGQHAPVSKHDYDDCEGLRPGDYVLPPNADAVTKRFVQAAERYCKDSPRPKPQKEDL